MWELFQGRGVAARGYKFLLLDVYSQLWIVLKEYIADAERRSGGTSPRLYSYTPIGLMLPYAYALKLDPKPCHQVIIMRST